MIPCRWDGVSERCITVKIKFLKTSKQKLYKRGMIFWLLACMHGTTAGLEHMCSRIAMRPLMRNTSSLGTKSSFVSQKTKTSDVVPSHWPSWKMGKSWMWEKHCIRPTHSPSHLDMLNAAWTHRTIGACNICALLQFCTRWLLSNVMCGVCQDFKDLEETSGQYIAIAPAIATPLADFVLRNMEPNLNLLDSECFAVCTCLAVSHQKACWISFKMFHER